MDTEKPRRLEGHPCTEDCCEGPAPYNPEHICSFETVCEDCYVLACANCGAECGCEL